MIWPDADPPGHKYAHAVARIVSELPGTEVSVYQYPTDVRIPKGWDLADDPPDEFTLPSHRELLSTPEWLAPEHDWQIHRLSELIASPPPPTPWLVDGVLKEGGISLLAGGPGSGKSVAARALAQAVVMGQLWAGRDTNAVPVLYLALEEDISEVRAQFQQVGMQRRFAEKLFVAESRPSEGMDTPESIAESLRWVLESDKWQPSPGLIIVDTLADLLNIPDYNSYADVQRYMAPILELARSTRSHVLLVHHNRKGRGRGTEKVMGSNAITGKVDCVMTITGRANGARILETVKQRISGGRELHEYAHLKTTRGSDGSPRMTWRTSRVKRDEEVVEDTKNRRKKAIKNRRKKAIKNRRKKAILRFLREEGPQHTNAILSGVRGRKATITALLRELVETEAVNVTEKVGSRGGKPRKTFSLPS